MSNNPEVETVQFRPDLPTRLDPSKGSGASSGTGNSKIRAIAAQTVVLSRSGARVDAVVVLLSAPSNLGLRPPEPGGVPGAGKAPEALRAAGLYTQLRAVDGGVVLPGRYVDDDGTRADGRIRNQDAIIEHARRLAQRLEPLLQQHLAPLVLGGDCSVLIGAGLASHGSPGVGLVHIDGHTDFRHPGNCDDSASLAGEDLAAAVGRHWPEIADIDGKGPYFQPDHVAHLGCRDDDTNLSECISTIAAALPGSAAIGLGMHTSAAVVLEAISTPAYWLQVDIDVLDPAHMPAVDSADPGGLSPDQLIALLRELAPSAVGASLTVFDPDLDPDGRYAALIVEIVTTGLQHLGEQPR